jgi:hypothetical protein
LAFVVAIISVVASRWIALANEALTTAPKEIPITAAERDHWAYKPLTKVEPPAVADPRFAAHPVDRFVYTAMAKEQVVPLPRAGRAALARRVWFDLTGLPPTAAELRAFLADDSANAYEKLVDRLLASPAYGERYAQHWLDLARFAETDGFEHDLVRPNAWRYRDWVIDALNRDLPFDEFVRQQIAGDQLRPNDRDARIATGFLLCGPDMPDLNLPEERRHVVLNEMTATVGAVFLGMQFGCAACHDHKFDPIRQHDFYRLRTFFESTDIFRDHPVPTAEEIIARERAEVERPPEHREREARRKELEDLARQKFKEKNPDILPTLVQALDELLPAEQKQHARLVKELQDAPPLPKLSQGRTVEDGEPRPGHLYLRGDFRQPGPVVECGFPRVLDVDAKPIGNDKPRAALAAWLTRADNPLFARVIANRLWQWHFGVGLSATASDFGLMGTEPTHPELLDWLALKIAADGWSLKKAHRMLVTSETYKLAAGPFDTAWSSDQVHEAAATFERSQAIDPDNRLLWHRRVQRLDGEAVRDAMLAACNKLSDRRGGPGIRAPLPAEVTQTLLKDQWRVSGDEEDHRRRSIYLFVRRNLRYPLFDVFDRPDTMASCALRHESTTATQSLTQLNSAFSLQAARWLAGAVLAEKPDSLAEQLAEVYLRVVNRPATPDELRAGEAFLVRQSQALAAEGRATEKLTTADPSPQSGDPYLHAALVDYCLAMLNSNEFLYVE